jgi:hypothetical protein
MKKLCHLPDLSEAQIRARWQWDKMPVVASRANIDLAVRRTGQSYGLAMNGRPYVAPVVGMTVETYHGEIGEIVEVRKPMSRGGDPEVKIALPVGGPVYLFQTASFGYSPRLRKHQPRSVLKALRLL